MANANMSDEYQRQLLVLEDMRRMRQQEQYAAAMMYPTNGSGQYDQYQPSNGYGGMEEPVHDPLIYQGVYAPSGFDIMSMLIKVRQRPNPTINIGNIDQSVALTVADAEVPDMPIVYCSDPFMNLVGYPQSEIYGRNCRFLQQPPASSGVKLASKDKRANEAARKELKAKMLNMEDACVELINFTRDGRRFVNVLTTVPITWDDGKRYVVGFQADLKRR